MSNTSPFKVFSGTNSRYLAEKICKSLGCDLGNMNITHFADGEFAVSFEESIRGSHVFLVQSTFPNSVGPVRTEKTSHAFLSVPN